MARLASRYRRQVRAESRLRFGPEGAEIRRAARDVKEQAAGDIRSAKQTAAGTKRAVRQAREPAKRSLADALAMISEGPEPGTEAALGELGSAAARDHLGAQKRLRETLAGIQTELTARELDADAGMVAAIRQARAVRGSELGKLADRLRDLAGQRGAFQQGRMGELIEDERDRRVTRRGQNLTLRGSRERTAAQNQRDAANRKSREQIAADKLAAQGGKNGRKRATSQQIITGQTQIDLARRQARRAKGDGESRSDAAKLLIEGQGQLKDPATGQPIPDTKYKPVKQLWASVALDLEYGGGISAANRKKLRRLGYSLADFGISPPKKHTVDRPAHAKAPGGSRPT